MRPFVRASVRPGVRPEKFLSTISYKAIDGISSDFVVNDVVQATADELRIGFEGLGVELKNHTRKTLGPHVS